MQIWLILIVLSGFSLIISGCSRDKTVTTKSGIKYTDLIEGSGTSADYGKTIIVNYIGTLPDGSEFDNTYKNGKTLEFKIGSNFYIKGLSEGVIGMKTGGKRNIIIPPELGYGADGAGSVVPGNSFLIFEVELVEVKY
ncbi:FKBP-type peptidyl-prolyl cis-trans isomerase [soil metagenome]